MRKFLILGLAVFTAACSSSDDGEKSNGAGSEPAPSEAPLEALNKDVKVTPLSISEHRYVQLEKGDDDFMMGGSGTTIELRLKGEAVSKSTRVGNIKITKAEDDLGNSLASDGSFHTSMQAIDRTGRFGEEQPEDETSVNVSLEASRRAATSITVLEGSVTLAVARVIDVEVPVSELKKRLGQKLEKETLRDAGIAVEISKLDQGGMLVEFKITDKDDLITATHVVSADGQRRDQGYSSGGFGSTITTQLFGQGPLADDDRLVISVETQRQDLEVPFKFQNLKLP